MERLKCDQLLHGSERYSVSNCYMGVRGTVRLTVTGKGEDDVRPTVFMGARGTVRPTVSWEREVQCDQLFHGSERYSATNCYMGVRGTVRPTCYIGSERYSATKCYMGVRGTVRPNVTWE